MNHIDSLRVAREVLEKLTWALLQAGGWEELILKISEIHQVLRHMEAVARDDPTAFQEYAVATSPPNPSEN